MDNLDTKRMKHLLLQKKYDVVLNSLEYHEHPLYFELIDYATQKRFYPPMDLSINDLKLTDEDIIGLVNQIRSKKLSDRIFSLGGIIVSGIAIVIGLYGLVLLVSNRGLFGVPYIFALPTGLFMFKMYYDGLRGK
jgi:hypothetical protein